MGLLREEVFMSGTYAAEALSLAACKATLQELSIKDYAQIISVGGALKRALGDWVTGYSTRLTFQLEEKKWRRVCGLLAERGILVGHDWFPMFAHTDEQLETTIAAIEEVKEIIDGE